MKKYAFKILVCLLIFPVLFGHEKVKAQYNFKNQEINNFQRKELIWGIQYSANKEREEIRTELWREYENLSAGSAKFLLKNRTWNFMDFKQEQFELNLETGPLWANGNRIDSSGVFMAESDGNIFGLRSNISGLYSSRFYYNSKNYTLVHVKGWGRYDVYNQNSTGISTDSNLVVTSFEKETTETKLRAAFEARAGWGIGRLKPMNDFMVADYLLRKYYSKNNLSQAEILRFANEIGRIKSQRNSKTGHKTEEETAKMQEFLNQKMFLIPVSSLEEEWKLSEISPRFTGNRIEFGPFFKYFNREPDFIYGGYFVYEHAKYFNVKWNRNFSAGINYNYYKKQDWVLGELNLGWSYYFNLKSQLDFGMKYTPGYALPDSENEGTLNHGVIPYVGYFTQIDAKNRIDIKLAYRFSEKEKLMVAGPEISVAVYRSRY